LALYLRETLKNSFKKPREYVSFRDMTDRKFTKVGELLPSILSKLGLEQRIKEQRVLALWPVVVGEELASRTRAIKIDHGVLYVRVDHGAWMQELHFIENDLLRRLRARAPGVKLTGIRFSSKDVC
jgi:predicted nucleic acid-binding Zn ribbon protein